MAWFKRIGRFVLGVTRSIFWARSTAGKLAGVAIALGLIGFALQERIQELAIELKAEYAGIAYALVVACLLAAGATVYAYELHARLEKVNSAKVVLREPPWAGFRAQEEYPIQKGKRVHRNVIHVRLEYSFRNGGDATSYRLPSVRWFARAASGRKWRDLIPEPVMAPSGHRKDGPPGSHRSAHFNRGGELEIPARQTSDWSASWQVAFPDEDGVEKTELLFEVTFEPLGQEPQILRLPLRLSAMRG